MIPWPPKPPSLISTRSLSPSSTVVISAGLPSRARRSRLLRLVDERLPEQLRERGPLLLDELPDDDLLSQADVELLQRREVLDDGVLPVVAELVDRLAEPVAPSVVDGTRRDDLDEGEALVLQSLDHRAAQPAQVEHRPAGHVGGAC